jgi:hypothetical protein
LKAGPHRQGSLPLRAEPGPDSEQPEPSVGRRRRAVLKRAGRNPLRGARPEPARALG